MDKDSINYDPDATKDNGSCKYQAQTVFWWDQTFANTMSTNSVSTIKVYNGGTFKGSLAVSGIYWTSAPSCGANSTITLTYDLGTSKSATAPFTFDLCDAANNVITTVSISYIIAANKCNTCQLQ